MKIIIETSFELTAKLKNKIKSDLENELRKFYGEILCNDEMYYYSKEDGIVVYLTERPLYPGFDKEIIDTVSMIMQSNVGAVPVKIKLNCDKIKHKLISEFPDNNDMEEKRMNKNEVKTCDLDYEILSEKFNAEEPKYSLKQVVLPDNQLSQIKEAIAIIQVEKKVFDEWGLRSIIPNASSILNFHGKPGTGKTMTAEAVAHYLGKKILKASYADLESKFLGEGPKMVKAIFKAAEREDAILFIDESETILSKRFSNVSDGSTQALNSMRSQLLICLEQFKGIVIFATNLVESYDKAFISRLLNIEFTLPDVSERYQIWKKHMIGPDLKIKLSDDVDFNQIAEKYEFCGREIRNTVKDACVTVALNGREIVCQNDIIKSCEKTKNGSVTINQTIDNNSAIKDETQHNINKRSVSEMN